MSQHETTAAASSSFSGRLQPADARARYTGLFESYRVELTPRQLRVSNQHIIPLAAIDGIEIITSRFLFLRRYALRIVYWDGATEETKDVFLCRVTPILGFYRLAEISRLADAIRVLRGESSSRMREPEELPVVRNEPSGLVQRVVRSVTTLLGTENEASFVFWRDTARARGLDPCDLPTTVAGMQHVLERHLGPGDGHEIMEAFVAEATARLRSDRLRALWENWWLVIVPGVFTLLCLFLMLHQADDLDVGCTMIYGALCIPVFHVAVRVSSGVATVLTIAYLAAWCLWDTLFGSNESA